MERGNSDGTRTKDLFASAGVFRLRRNGSRSWAPVILFEHESDYAS